MKQKYQPGIFYPPKLNVWPHERKTATTLAEVGYFVEFRHPSRRSGVRSADCYINGELWELKSPNGSKISIVEQNLRRAKRQSNRVVFDSQRIKRLPDAAVERELRAKLPFIREISIIKFINKQKRIIDITSPF